MIGHYCYCNMHRSQHSGSRGTRGAPRSLQPVSTATRVRAHTHRGTCDSTSVPAPAQSSSRPRARLHGAGARHAHTYLRWSSPTSLQSPIAGACGWA